MLQARVLKMRRQRPPKLRVKLEPKPLQKLLQLQSRFPTARHWHLLIDSSMHPALPEMVELTPQQPQAAVLLAQPVRLRLLVLLAPLALAMEISTGTGRMRIQSPNLLRYRLQPLELASPLTAV